MLERARAHSDATTLKSMGRRARHRRSEPETTSVGVSPAQPPLPTESSESTHNLDQPPTIVLDSNVWLREQMLRHSAGSALRFHLHTSGARVAVPEVVRLEVALHLDQDLKELSRGIRESHARLLRLVGSLKELVLPSDHALEEVAKKAFESARIDIFDVPFSLESARASFEKCIKGEPPSGPKDQQFKDGVLWADCVRLANDGPVLLVTADKGFYREKMYANGLAPNLIAEAVVTSYGISIAEGLSAILEIVRGDVPIDYDVLSNQFLSKFGDHVQGMPNRLGFVLGERFAGEHKLFATDSPAEAHLEFELSYRCMHSDGRDGILIARGEGTYSPSTATTTDLQSRGDEFQYYDVDGQKKSTRAHVFVGSVVLGHRTVYHDVRFPLTD